MYYVHYTICTGETGRDVSSSGPKETCRERVKLVEETLENLLLDLLLESGDKGAEHWYHFGLKISLG